MSIFNLFHKPKVSEDIKPTANPTEDDFQMVIVQFFYGIEDISELHKMEEDLRQLILDSCVGEYHGHEISMDFGDGYLFIVGKDANDIFNCVKPLLESHYFMDRAIATLRKGSFEKLNAEEHDHVLRFKKYAALS